MTVHAVAYSTVLTVAPADSIEKATIQKSKPQNRLKYKICTVDYTKIFKPLTPDTKNRQSLTNFRTSEIFDRKSPIVKLSSMPLIVVEVP